MSSISQMNPGGQICPGCRAQVGSGLNFCVNCGQPLAQADVCASCGTPLPVGGRFCAVCGAPAPAAYPSFASLGACFSCGTVLAPGLTFCTGCGAAVGYSPPPPLYGYPPATRRSNVWRWPLVGGGIFLLLAVVGFLALAIFDAGDSTPVTDIYASDSLFNTKNEQAAVDRAAGDIEKALRAGDVASAISLIHPDKRDEYQTAFQSHKGELAKLADVLASRKPKAIAVGLAEYEITKDGKKTFLTFTQSGGQWYLLSL
jgi:hypothetical protein